MVEQEYACQYEDNVRPTDRSDFETPTGNERWLHKAHGEANDMELELPSTFDIVQLVSCSRFHPMTELAITTAAVAVSLTLPRNLSLFIAFDDH